MYVCVRVSALHYLGHYWWGWVSHINIVNSNCGNNVCLCAHMQIGQTYTLYISILAWLAFSAAPIGRLEFDKCSKRPKTSDQKVRRQRGQKSGTTHMPQCRKRSFSDFLSVLAGQELVCLEEVTKPGLTDSVNRCSVTLFVSCYSTLVNSSDWKMSEGVFDLWWPQCWTKNNHCL